MTLVTIPVTTYPPFALGANLTSSGARAALRLDSTTTRVAVILTIPYSGTIDKIVWCTGNVTDGAKDVDIGIYALDANGDPDISTAYKGMAVATRSTNQASLTLYEDTLGTAATNVVAGDTVAVIFSWNGGTAGDIYLNQANLTFLYVYGSQYTAGTTSWARSTSYVTGIICHYSDGGGFYAPSQSPPVSALSFNAYEANDAIDEYGLSFTPPFACRAIGAWFYGGCVNLDATFTVILYEGTTARATYTQAANVSVGAGSYGQRLCMFAAPYTLTKDTTYILAVKSTAASKDIRFYYATIYSGAQRGYGLPSSAGSVTRADTAAWSTPVDQATYPIIGLLIDQVDDGTGTGGGGGTKLIGFGGGMIG
jgi:hypothetical protein